MAPHPANSNADQLGSGRFLWPPLSTRPFTHIFLLFLASILPGRASDSFANVRAVLERHCFACHGEEKQKGKIRLDTVSTDLLNDQQALETWHEVRAVINLGEMPPEDRPALNQEERGTLLSWLNAELRQVAEKRRSTGGRTVLRRLNRVEYQNTMRDLFDFDINYIQDFPPDAVSIDGMSNNGKSLRMSSIHLDYYLKAARHALDQVLVSNEPPPVFNHRFDQTNESKWPQIVPANRLGRGREFIARIQKDYPEWGEIRIRIQARAELPDRRGPIPRMRVTVGYRPDTLVTRKTLAQIDITQEGSQTYEFTGRVENFPLPVRGQGKFPGLVISVINAYDEHAQPLKREVKDEKGKKQTVFDDDPDYPYLVIESLEFEGPCFDSWPPRHHRRLLPAAGARDEDELAYVQTVLKRFLPRAWRRPVQADEIARFVDFYKNARPEHGEFLDALRDTLAMALISPQFLFLLEPTNDANPQPLNEFELAARLSYFLWSSMPDRELTLLADLGVLSHPEVLAQQVNRMIVSNKSWQFIEQFTTQWLDLNAMERLTIDSKVYPKFEPELKPGLRDETLHFFAEILRNNLSARNFLDADFAVMNDNVARHYGLPAVPGGQFRRVELSSANQNQRGGLLTQASILMAGSNGRDSSPIKRAVFLRRRLLDDPPAPPPPNVPDLETANADFAQLPIREQLELHSHHAACMDCHRGIDPWGHAMEHYDAVGLWRDHIQRRINDKPAKKIPVDSKSRLPGGHEVDGLEELKQFLLSHRLDQFARAFVSKVLTYSLGRTLEFSDEITVEEMTQQFIDDDLRVAGLIRSLVTSEIFQRK